MYTHPHLLHHSESIVQQCKLCRECIALPEVMIYTQPHNENDKNCLSQHEHRR